ncbi:MAG: hypothetical protein GEU26_08760 [Nitrososphaeraceae archaeon]|nr:hypothetical protein [Nitrososphaeraceae archaeon]
MSKVPEGSGLSSSSPLVCAAYQICTNLFHNGVPSSS